MKKKITVDEFYYMYYYLTEKTFNKTASMDFNSFIGNWKNSSLYQIYIKYWFISMWFNEAKWIHSVLTQFEKNIWEFLK